MICNKCKNDVMQTFDELCIECFDIPDDEVVDIVVDKYKKRAREGYLKYKTNLMRQDLTTFDWINHLMEELMDATLYLQRLKMQINALDVSIEDEEDLHFKLSEQGYFDTIKEDDES